MKFKVKDNYGKVHISKDYEWNKQEGIPCEDMILDDMERPCSNNCANESTNVCDCPSEFDEGEVIGVITPIGEGDKEK